MVQRKEANNKHLGIKLINSLITEKNEVNTKNTILNHDTKSQGGDMKAIKMKKSRSTKRSDTHKAPRQPGKPPPLVTPRCKKQTPNYMKGTNSSEARKEKITTNRSSVLSTSKLNKVVKTLAKTCSLKKVKTLTKSPSFKHTRTTTCSSTLKDYKFPPYLELYPGATEAQGKSKRRVCSYNHCSLNDHPHTSTPPLKRFLSLRRRQIKSLKVSRPENFSPRTRKTSECKNREVVTDHIEDFFIDLFVIDKDVATQVSESISDGPRSEVDFHDNLDEHEDVGFSETKFTSEGGCTPSNVENQPSFGTDSEVESSPSVSSDEFCCENSEIEWEEGQTYAISEDGEILTESHCSDDQRKPDYEESNFGENLEESYKYPPYFQDEIVEFLCFSDADSLADSESIQPGKGNTEGPVFHEKDEMHSALYIETTEENSTLAIEATIHASKLEDEPEVEKMGYFSNLIIDETEAQNEDLKSYDDSSEFNNDESDEDNYVAEEIREANATDISMGEKGLIEETLNNIPQISENSGDYSAKGKTSKGNNDGQTNLIEVKLHSHSDNVVEEESSEIEENNSAEEVDTTPETKNQIQKPTKCVSNNGESYSNQEQESCNKSIRVMRSRKENDTDEKEREFNPRGPNFLDIEPDPEDEKVDLRHQEMDDRKNAEEWMLDYALRRAVNQLGPARKKKVALLVEAFETVLPV